MDRWACEQLDPWLEIRRGLPIGAVRCVIHGPTAGRRWEASAARKQLHHAAAAAGVRRRFAPHQLRHAHAVEMAHNGVPLVVIQRQLGHANLGITSVYLQEIDSSEIISAVHGRPSPTICATAGLELTRQIETRPGRRWPTGRPDAIPPAGEYGVSWIACGEPCLRAGAGICRPGVRVARRDPGAPRRPGSTAEELHQRGVGFLRIGPADVVWAVLDLDDGEVRDQLFVSQPCGGRLERQDPVGGAVDH